VTVRRVDIFGRRITRLRTTRDYETVQAAHFEFRRKAEGRHEESVRSPAAQVRA
jgi:hypothetical protein